MVTVDQFLYALAIVESSNDPHAWGDGDRAVGTWQVHIDRLWSECARLAISPSIGERFNHLVERVLGAIFSIARGAKPADQIAMYWHLGHWSAESSADWDLDYAAAFADALAQAQKELP